MVTDITIPVSERPVTQLKFLHSTRQSVQKLRIQLGNRVSAVERGVDEQTEEAASLFNSINGYADSMELAVDRQIARELKRYPVWDYWLKDVKGIGPSLGGQLLALLLPPTPLKGPSSWYKAAGLDPQLMPDGQYRIRRPRAGGGKITYHPGLRTSLYNVGASFIKSQGFYRTQYDTYKATVLEQHAAKASSLMRRWQEQYLAPGANEISVLEWLYAQFDRVAVDKAMAIPSGKVNRLAPTFAKCVALCGTDEEWSLYRIDSVARWKTIKLFLCHLWEAWSAAENIPLRNPDPRMLPYAIQHLNHQTWIPRPVKTGTAKI